MTEGLDIVLNIWWVYVIGFFITFIKHGACVKITRGTHYTGMEQILLEGGVAGLLWPLVWIAWIIACFRKDMDQSWRLLFKDD